MGLFLSIDMRPNLFRCVSRNLPADVRRELAARLVADPAFIFKMFSEHILCFTIILFFQAFHRGRTFIQELDYVTIDLIQSIIAHTWLIWTLASSRSFGLAHRIPLIGVYTAVPNYIFDTSTKYKNFNMTARVLCALMK